MSRKYKKEPILTDKEKINLILFSPFLFIGGIIFLIYKLAKNLWE